MKPGQEKAVSIVWSSFGLSWVDRVTPIIAYKTGRQLDCPGGFSWYGWTLDKNEIWKQQCLLGQYVRAMHFAFVAWPRGMKFSKSAFAHELCHAYFHDENHAVCDESIVGNPITNANRLLEKEGL